MKNAKYLLVIAAFATLAFVGFSAFTAHSGNVAVPGKVTGYVKIYAVCSSKLKSNPTTTPTVEGFFLNREEAETHAQSFGGDGEFGTPSKVLYVIEGYIDAAVKSEITPKWGSGW